jgi:hypothetical protein
LVEDGKIIKNLKNRHLFNFSAGHDGNPPAKIKERGLRLFKTRFCREGEKL